MIYKEQKKLYTAACYARLSVDDLKDGTSVSIETQIKILEDYCKTNGIVVYDYYCDDGFTGTNFNRPSFVHMMQDADNKKFNMVIVKDLSRFGREYIGVGKYIEDYFPSNGIRFVAIGDGYDSDMSRNDLDFVVPMKNIFNQFYPADCSRKVRQAFKVKASRGEFIGSQAPYGYLKSEADKHILIIDAETAPIVKRIFTLIAYHGYGFTKIARTFSREKILTPYARQQKLSNKPCEKDPYDWNLGSVRAIVNNETYLGNLVSGKREVLSFKNKKVIKKDKDDWIVVKNMFPEIITQQLWDDVHEKVQQRKRTDTSGFNNIFAGLIRCDVCGKVLGISSKAGRSRYYCCETYKKKGKDRCTAHYTTYQDIYDAVLEDIRNVVSQVKTGIYNFNGQIANIVLEEMKQEQPPKITIEEIEEQIRKIDKRYEQMYQDRLDDVISLQRFQDMARNNEIRREELQKQIESMRRDMAEQSAKSESIDRFIETVESLGEITKLDAVLLNTLIEKIVVSERRLVDGEYTQDIEVCYKFNTI